MIVAMFFNLAAVCIIAPHLTWKESKKWALVCMALAVGFGVIEAAI